MARVELAAAGGRVGVGGVCRGGVAASGGGVTGHRWDEDAETLTAAADRIDRLRADGGTIDGGALLVALQTVFIEARNNVGLCCTLDCAEHGALVRAAEAILREEETDDA